MAWKTAFLELYEVLLVHKVLLAPTLLLDKLNNELSIKNKSPNFRSFPHVIY